MKFTTLEPPPPLVLIVDDEKQVHASLRLRLEHHCDVVCCTNVHDALSKVAARPFDVCIVDLHMPEMHGATFIQEARKVDPGLGFLIFTGNDTDENLRRAIPLQVFDFIPKPLPARDRLESRVPEWAEKTRIRRREIELAKESDAIVRDLEISLIEREIETVAAEAARVALLQTAETLTTGSALLLSASHALEPLKADPKLAGIYRTLTEARRTIEGASTLTENYFSSAYANRDAAITNLDAGIRDAVRIGLRQAKAESRHIVIDQHLLNHAVALKETSGIDLLLMLVPIICQALEAAADGTTIQLRAATVARLDEALRDIHLGSFIWFNRRRAVTSNPGVVISLRGSAAPLDPDAVSTWLNGEAVAGSRVPGRAVAQGIRKSKGLFGFAALPELTKFETALVLPV